MLNREIKIIKVADYANTFSEIFSENLKSLNYQSTLIELHNEFPRDYDPNNIAEVSNSSACNALYLAIKNSKNFEIKNPKHESFHQKYNFEFEYIKLLKYLFDELQIDYKQYLYQINPTIRVQFPGVNTSSVWHVDSEFGHPRGEINFWMPITQIYESTSLWFSVDEVEFVPKLTLGELLCFDGEVRHGTKVNTTTQTRVSIDFRVISKVDFIEYLKNNKDITSIARNIKFSTNYYKEF